VLGGIHQRHRARDCGVPDGGRISAPALCSTGNTLQRSDRNRLPWLVGESGLRSPTGRSPPRTRGGSAHDHDLNLRAAYMHVLADAFTSILAITALTGGKFFGWGWLDPVVGIVGSGVVFSWSYTLLRETGGILLDRTPPSSDLPDEIRRAVESDGDSVVTDLHVWQVGIGKFAAMVSIVAHEPKSCDSYRALLRGYHELVHVTIETHHCPEDHASVASA
jgi:cation diffusion facilitator family transporter